MYATHDHDFIFNNGSSIITAPLSAEQKRFKLVLHSGNSAMFIAVLGMIFSIFVGYIDVENYSLWAQVASHITLILFATAIKIGYVMRCIGLHGLGATQL